MARRDSDDSHWDSEFRRARDCQREPTRRYERRARAPLNASGTLRSLFAKHGEPVTPASTKPLASIISAIADRCYACDARAIGTRDRRPEGGQLERACARHADGGR